MSNYSWNSLLSEHISSIAKKVNPDCITAQGGPNFPHDDEQQKIFMRQRSSTDIFYNYGRGDNNYQYNKKNYRM